MLGRPECQPGRGRRCGADSRKLAGWASATLSGSGAPGAGAVTGGKAALSVRHSKDRHVAVFVDGPPVFSLMRARAQLRWPGLRLVSRHC